MQVIVPAAGKGTRLRPLTSHRPKGLVPIGGTPLLAYVFRTAIALGATEIIVVVPDEESSIRNTFGPAFATTPLRYVTQPAPRGLGDAVLQASAAVTDQFVVLNGDNVFATPPLATIRRAADPGIDGAIAIEEAAPGAAQTTGVVAVENDRVRDIEEKPSAAKSNLITTGCYVLPEEIFEILADRNPPCDGELELSEAVTDLVEHGNTIAAVPPRGPRVNVNRPADLTRARQLLEVAPTEGPETSASPRRR